MKQLNFVRLFVILFLIAAGTVNFSFADRIDDLYLEAMEAEDSAVSNADFKKAAALYSELVTQFSKNENIELIAASLFSIGDISQRKLNDPKAAYNAFYKIKTNYPDSSWIDRASQELEKLEEQGFMPSEGSKKSGNNPINNSIISGLGIGPGQSMGFEKIADKINDSLEDHFYRHSSGFALSADKNNWKIITSIPQPGFLLFLRPVNDNKSGYPCITLTSEENLNMSSSKSWADRIKSDAANILPLYKIIAQQDLVIENINVHEIFSYYVNNDKGVIQKQTFIPFNNMMFTLTCTDFKDDFMKSLEEFKKITKSISLK